MAAIRENYSRAKNGYRNWVLFENRPVLYFCNIIYLVAGLVEISTERGANILFQYKYIYRTKVLEGIRKNVNIYTIPQQLKFLMPMMIQFYMI